MNRDQIEGNWKQLKGKARQQWGKLTDDHIEQIKGNRDMLSGKIQELYGLTKEEADKQIDSFSKSYSRH
ncbi:MAG TPA: CsbD family protein [Methyloradius sp.]